MVRLSTPATVFKHWRCPHAAAERSQGCRRQSTGVIAKLPSGCTDVGECGCDEAWDKVAAKYVAKDPFFAEVYNSQKEYAKKIVEYRREFYVPYDLVAEHYWPKKK